ncbi:MAG: hypothetical protein PF448_12445 [Bacteroidales bacterium]|nr:hypothetical protein [Bacteroidales bacterium]
MDNLYFEQYYSNGFIRQKGIISNSVLNGYSIEYSIDSMIVWSGLYKNGKRVYPDTLNFSPMNFNLFIDAKTYCIDSTPILFKIITPYHPNDITPFATNCKFTWHEESNTYKIEPTDTGFIKIGMMKWFDENPITIYIDSIFVTDNSNTSKNLEE